MATGYPDGMDEELLVKAPHDELYVLYLKAKIDAENGEYSRYADSSQLYNEAYGNFVRYWICSSSSGVASSTSAAILPSSALSHSNFSSSGKAFGFAVSACCIAFLGVMFFSPLSMMDKGGRGSCPTPALAI